MAHTVVTKTQRHVVTAPDAEEAVIVDEPVYETATSTELFTFTRFVNYLLGIVESLLILRFLLRFFGANPAAGFTQLIYTLSEPFMLPFRGIFRSAAAAGSVFETSILVAMVVYYLLALALIHLVRLLTTRPTTTA